MRVNKELLKGSTMTLVLSILSKQAMYGYELIKEIEARSNGVFLMKEGTLYPILHTLESDGWLLSYWEQKDGRKRKYYKITDEGSRLLQEKTQEWIQFRTAVDTIIGEGE